MQTAFDYLPYINNIKAGICVANSTLELWNAYKKMIHKIVFVYAKNDEDLEDLEQEGFMQIPKAANKFNPDCGVLFSTYLGTYVRNAAIAYTKKNSSLFAIPDRVVANVYKYKKLITAEGATHKNVCALMGLSEREGENIQRAILAENATSMNKPIELGDGVADLGDIIADAKADEEQNSFFKAMTLSVIADAIEELPEEQRKTLQLFYWGNKSIDEIAEVLHKSKAHVTYVKKAAIQELKRNRDVIEANKEIYGYDSSKAYAKGGLSALRGMADQPVEQVAMAHIEADLNISKSEKKQKNLIELEQRIKTLVWEQIEEDQRRVEMIMRNPTKAFSI